MSNSKDLVIAVLKYNMLLSFCSRDDPFLPVQSYCFSLMYTCWCCGILYGPILYLWLWQDKNHIDWIVCQSVYMCVYVIISWCTNYFYWCSKSMYFFSFLFCLCLTYDELTDVYIFIRALETTPKPSGVWWFTCWTLRGLHTKSAAPYLITIPSMLGA